MRISRETDYAMRCVLHLSVNPGQTCMVEEMAQARGVPRSFLAKILQKLKRANIVESFRGVKGGFALARKPSDISLLDVIEAIQGVVSLNICAVDEKACDRSGDCVIHPVWVILREDFQTMLGKFDFQMLADDEFLKEKKEKK